MVVTAKHLCGLYNLRSLLIQKRVISSDDGDADVPRDNITMRELYQLLRAQSAQLSALQRQQDTGSTTQGAKQLPHDTLPKSP